MPLHSPRAGNPHAKPPLSSFCTTATPFSTPAEFHEPLNLFRISRLPPSRGYLTESLHLEVVRALLAAKADVNAKRADVDGNDTALTLASSNGNLEMVQALLAAIADVDAKAVLARPERR